MFDKTTTNVILNTKPYTSGISNAAAHVGEYLIKDTKLVCVGTIKLLKLKLLVWRYFSNNKNELKDKLLLLQLMVVI
jgi:hypothetical protein